MDARTHWIVVAPFSIQSQSHNLISPWPNLHLRFQITPIESFVDANDASAPIHSNTKFSNISSPFFFSFSRNIHYSSRLIVRHRMNVPRVECADCRQSTPTMAQWCIAHDYTAISWRAVINAKPNTQKWYNHKTWNWRRSRVCVWECCVVVCSEVNKNAKYRRTSNIFTTCIRLSDYIQFFKKLYVSVAGAHVAHILAPSNIHKICRSSYAYRRFIELMSSSSPSSSPSPPFTPFTPPPFAPLRPSPTTHLTSDERQLQVMW